MAPSSRDLERAGNRSVAERHLWDMTSLATSAAPTNTASWVASAVAQAVSGDETAFARIVDAYHRDLVRVAYVVTGDEQLAEDAAQSAWSIAWRKLGSLRDPERLRPWLVSVAANEARQLVRSRRRRTVAEIRVRPLDDAVRGPEVDIDHLDLLAVLRRLKPEDRRLLAMQYVGGLEPTEIAPLVGMSPSGVRGHLSRVRDQLRKELRDG